MKPKPYVVTGKALIRDRKGRILLIRRAMSCKNFKGKWELPGGKPDPGETIDAALRREVKEETGLALRDMYLAGVAEAKIPRYRIVYVIFETRAKPGKVKLSEENTASTWAGLQEAMQLDLCPGIDPLLHGLAGVRQRGRHPASTMYALEPR